MSATTERRQVAQELIAALEHLDQNELDQIARHVRRLRSAKPSSEPASREAELLRVIKRRKPRELRETYVELIAKRDNETLTSDEHEELLRLTDQAEAFNVRWLEAISALSKLRQVPVSTLIQELGNQANPSG